MKKMIMVMAAALVFQGCALIMQDGDVLKKHYGIRGDDAVALTQMIRSARGDVSTPGGETVDPGQASVSGAEESAGSEPQQPKIK